MSQLAKVMSGTIQLYSSSGVYYTNFVNNNNYSISLDGNDDILSITNPADFKTFMGWIKIGPNSTISDAILASQKEVNFLE